MAFPSGWSRKCAITVDNTQVTGTGTLTAFPICLTAANLPSEMLDKDGSFPAQMGGGDIRFTSDAAGTTKLPCHVIKFITHNTPASGEALIYVAADVAGTVDTTIYVWYNTATRIEQPKHNANTDSDGFQGSDYTWANYLAMYQLGGFGGLRNLKQANASKNIGRYGNALQPKPYTVKAPSGGDDYYAGQRLIMVGERLYCALRAASDHFVVVDGDVEIYTSDDLGQTWAIDSGLSVTDASFDLREANLLLQSDGTLWLFYTKVNSADTTRVVYYRKSSAPYSSWGSETVLTTPTKANNAGKPIELASGTIVVPCYEIDGSANTAPFIRWSTDSGSSWTTDYLTADGNPPTFGAYSEFSVAEDPATAGNLVAILRRDGFTNLYRQTSTDSGQTWSSAAANIAIDATPPDMPEIQYCQDGDLVLGYAKDRASPEYLLVRSTDHGATWQSDFGAAWYNATGSTEPGGYAGIGGYLSFVEVARGLFAVVYYHDAAFSGPAAVWCTHVTKVEDGAFNVFTDTTKQIAATVGKGIELDDTGSWIGNASLSFFNQIHNAGAFTLSGWAKFNQVSDELHCFAGSSASSNDRGFFFGYENRTAAGSPDKLRLFVANGSGGNKDNLSASAISGDTAAHRFGVFCDAAGTPTFIKDQTTYAGSAALTNYAGDAGLSTRIGGVANGADDLATGRLDGWMGMWGLSTVNLGADYEKTRYSSEVAPGTFAAAGTPTTTELSIDVDAANFAATFATCSTVADRQLAVSQTSYSTAFAAVTLAYSGTGSAAIDVDASSYSVTFSNPVLKTARKSPVNPAAFSTTFANVDLAVDSSSYAVSIDAASYSISFSPVTLTYDPASMWVRVPRVTTVWTEQ